MTLAFISAVMRAPRPIGLLGKNSTQTVDGLLRPWVLSPDNEIRPGSTAPVCYRGGVSESARIEIFAVIRHLHRQVVIAT